MTAIISSGAGSLEQVRTLVPLTMAFFILSCSLQGKTTDSCISEAAGLRGDREMDEKGE